MKLGYFCVKMTVAIQVEGHTAGMQRVEERYVLYKARSAAEAIAKAEVAASAYGKLYHNSNGEQVRWQVERIEEAYEAVAENPRSLDGAEVFSVLKTRKLTPERTWA